MCSTKGGEFFAPEDDRGPYSPFHSRTASLRPYNPSAPQSFSDVEAQTHFVPPSPQEEYFQLNSQEAYTQLPYPQFRGAEGYLPILSPASFQPQVPPFSAYTESTSAEPPYLPTSSAQLTSQSGQAVFVPETPGGTRSNPHDYRFYCEDCRTDIAFRRSTAPHCESCRLGQADYDETVRERKATHLNAHRKYIKSEKGKAAQARHNEKRRNQRRALNAKGALTDNAFGRP